MPRTCEICQRDNVGEINEKLASGVPLRTITDQCGPSKTSLIRHRRHLPVSSLAPATQTAEKAATGTLARIERLQELVDRILASAEETKNLETLIRAVREARGNLELIAKLTGELRERNLKIGTLVQVQDGMPDLSKLSTAEVLALRELVSKAHGAVPAGGRVLDIGTAKE